jgi:ATP/ADP translocase
VIKKTVAVLAGTVVMVILDLLIARFITRSLTIGISVSVLVGALVASLIIEKHEWFFGLLVGIINCCITLGIFYLFSPQVPLRENGYSMADVVVRPMVLSLVFGIVGGVIGRWLKIILGASKDKITV